MKKRIYIILFLCLIGFGFVKQNAWAAGARLEFTPSDISLRPGDTETVDIYLTPNGSRVIGVDVMLKFDPSTISIKSITGSGVFPSQLGTQIDDNGGTAKVAFSNPYGVFVTDPAKIAQVEITGKAEGVSSVQFDFTTGKTSDTNVIVEHGVDSLAEVGSLKVVVSNSSGVPEVSPSPTPTPTPGLTDSPSPSPRNGKDKDRNNDKGNRKPSPTGIPQTQSAIGEPKPKTDVLGAVIKNIGPASGVIGWWLPVLLVGTAAVLLIIVLILNLREKKSSNKTSLY